MTYLKNHGANPKYYHKMVGGNFRLDTLQAVVLDIKLKYLDGWTAARQENAQYYTRGIMDRKLEPEITPPTALPGNRHIYNQFIIRSKKRDALLSFLRSKNIGCEIYYPVTFNNQECFSYLNYKTGGFPEAEMAAAETLAIPIYPELTIHQKDYILDCLDAFVKNG